MKTQSIIMTVVTVLAVGFWLAVSCTGTSGHAISGGNLTIYFNDQLHSQVMAGFSGKSLKLGDYSPSEYVSIMDNPVTDFPLKSKNQASINDQWGAGTQLVLIGETDQLRKEVTVTVYQDFPDVAVYQVTYSNIGNSDVVITGWVNNQYRVKARTDQQDAPPFWSFLSGSYDSRPDWILPLRAGFDQQNYMGMNASDYGGGTPVVDVWRTDVGIGVGSLEMAPRLLYLPVEMPDSVTATLGVKFKGLHTLKPGESLETYTTFVAVHQGDFFQTLTNYRKMMEKAGITQGPFPPSVYEPAWCAWGYRRDFTVEQVYNTLPKVKELGYKWAVLDDGWQTSEGDWYLMKSKFPNGDKDMIKMVDKIKEYGLRPGLWWAPLAVDPGTDLIKEHPEYLLLNQDGSTQDITWWDSYYLCPAYPPVQEYTRKLVETFIKTWGYEGLKIDGQHLNAAPPCYNPAHNHAYPEEAFEKIPEFFKVIYETALAIVPDAVIQICPCGTAYAFHTMPYMNQSVASDPESSWQIRLKGKTFKALSGPSAPYYGDHVELSDTKQDFATSVGIGAVIGTKFTWPVGAMKDGRDALTPEKEIIWKKWADIYLEKMLPTGEYLGNLYDLGFDQPEAHAIRKDGNMFYAFYAETYNGEVELRGLENRSYQLWDYENEKDYGTIRGPVVKVPVSFQEHLLLEARAN